MQARIKALVQQGDLLELKTIFLNKENPLCLIESITSEDFDILKKNDLTPSWESAGVGTNPNMPYDPNYRYEEDWDGKYVYRYKRVPSVDSYENCIEFVNFIRKKAGMLPLTINPTIPSEIKLNTCLKSDSALSSLKYSELLSSIFKQDKSSPKSITPIPKYSVSYWPKGVLRYHQFYPSSDKPKLRSKDQHHSDLTKKLT